MGKGARQGDSGSSHRVTRRGFLTTVGAGTLGVAVAGGAAAEVAPAAA
ncbi:MAG: hypothetical protein V1750_07680 [Acidobacteriota bacterium]